MDKWQYAIIPNLIEAYQIKVKRLVWLISLVYCNTTQAMNTQLLRFWVEYGTEIDVIPDPTGN